VLVLVGIIGFIVFLFSDTGRLFIIGTLGLIGHGLIWILLIASVLGVFK